MLRKMATILTIAIALVGAPVVSNTGLDDAEAHWRSSCARYTYWSGPYKMVPFSVTQWGGVTYITHGHYYNGTILMHVMTSTCR